MFTRILVPLDGSARAEAALPVAARLARASQGNLILAQALAYPWQWVGTAPLVITSEILDDDAASARAYLTTQSHAPELAGIPCEIDAAFGLVVPTLLQSATAHQADAIVMTTHGRTGLARWALGSVAQQMINQATLPLLALPDRAVTQGDLVDATAPLEVFVPLDGSPVAELAIAPAVALIQALAHPTPGSAPDQTPDLTAAPNAPAAPSDVSIATARLHAGLHLVMVMQPAQDDPLPGTERALLEQGARTYLNETSQRLRATHPTLTITWRIEMDPDIAAAILRMASANPPAGETPQAHERSAAPTVIVMTTHGRTGLARWTLGSVTDRVLRGSQRAILVVRPQEATTRSGRGGGDGQLEDRYR